jgi:hypothetical protein
MRADDKYLMKYREEQDKIRLAQGTEIILIGGDSIDIIAIASHFNRLLYQQQLIRKIKNLSYNILKHSSSIPEYIIY